MQASMEQLDYEYTGAPRQAGFAPVLVGVVASGNLEVMIEPRDDSNCAVHIATSARGYGQIWRAVMDAFHQRHAMGGITISINDMGATPAVVSLRLDQAASALKGSA